MKCNEVERKGMKTERFLRYSPFFSETLRFSPEMTEKTTENDREKRVIRKRLWNEMERNGMIFRIFSMIFHGYSVKIPYICIGLTR